MSEIAELIERVGVEEGRTFRPDVTAAAGRLVALVEGLSNRWLTGAEPADRLQRLLAEAITLEVPDGRLST